MGGVPAASGGEPASGGNFAIWERYGEGLRPFCEARCAGLEPAAECRPLNPNCFDDCVDEWSGVMLNCPPEVGEFWNCADEHPEVLNYTCVDGQAHVLEFDPCQMAMDAVQRCHTGETEG